MTSIQPELWVESPREALAFYEAAFGATVLHCVGDGDDIVAQLGVGEAAFWVAPASPIMKRLSPRAIDGTTSRTLLVVEDPDTVVRRAVAAGRNPRTWATSTGGGSAGSSTHSATSGRSARHSDRGHRARAERLAHPVRTPWWTGRSCRGGRLSAQVFARPRG